MWLPFLCLAAGAVLAKYLRPLADRLIHYSLLALLMGLGIRIGSDRRLLTSIPELGLKAAIICVLSSAASILLVLIWEKLFLKNSWHDRENNRGNLERAFAHEYLFIVLVVIFLLLGIITGHFISIPGARLEQGITLVLILIYTSVGVGLKNGVAGLGSSRNKLAFVLIPVLILLGSVGGGLLSSLFIKANPLVLGGIGGGATYYSLTTAMITQKSGVELGLIAFLANFLREVLTFFLTPLLVRLSYLAPLALGGASTMDTTLAVMKRFLGEEYALLGFISGTLLTLLVPVLLLFLLSF